MVCPPHLQETQVFQIIHKSRPTLKRRSPRHCLPTVVLDTTGKTPAESFDELLRASEPLVTMGELAVRAMAVPEGEYEVVYERGVRKTVSK